MSGNVSSSINHSVLHPDLPSINSDLLLDLYCFIDGPSSFIVTSFQIINIILLLPLCIFVLYHGLRQWRQKCSTASAAAMSHCDCFTYHMVFMELIGILGCFLSRCGVFSKQFNILLVGYHLFTFAWFGQVLFHVLTCVEHYLAVVHPITYLSLRKERGIRIRNTTIGCVWLLCIVATGLLMEDIFIGVHFSILIFSLTTVIFCSLSVLCALIRPGPGEQGRARKRLNQSKQRVFYTIAAILGMVVVKFVWALAWAVLFVSEGTVNCVLMTSDLWFNLPCSLVLPLLFLHRAGKLMCCKKSSNDIER